MVHLFSSKSFGDSSADKAVRISECLDQGRYCLRRLDGSQNSGGFISDFRIMVPERHHKSTRGMWRTDLCEGSDNGFKDHRIPIIEGDYESGYGVSASDISQGLRSAPTYTSLYVVQSRYQWLDRAGVPGEAEDLRRISTVCCSIIRKGFDQKREFA